MNAKRILTVIGALSALTLLGGARQARAQYGDRSTLQPEPAAEKSDQPPKKVVLGGRLNDDGTIFVPDSDLHSWKINNPNAAAVKHHRNEHITINAIQDFRTGSLTVQSASRNDQVFSTNPSRR